MTSINKVFFILAVFFLPIQTLYMDVGFSLKLSQILFFLLATGIFIDGLYKQESSSSGVLNAYAFFVLSVAVSISLSTLLSVQIQRSLMLYFALLISLFISYLTAWLIYKNSWLSVFVNSYLTSSYVTSVYGVVQIPLFLLGYGGVVNFNEWDLIPRVPFFSNENYHANFLIVALCVQVSRIVVLGASFWRVFFIALNCAALFAANSRAAILALAGGVAVLFCVISTWRIARVVKWGTVFSLCSLVLVVVAWDTLFVRFSGIADSDGTIGERVLTYKNALVAWEMHPLFGQGLGTVLELTGRDVHDMYLMVLAEAGLFSFLAFCALYIFSGVVLSLCVYRLSDLEFDVTPQREDMYGLIAGLCAVLLHALAEPALYNMHIYVVLGALVGGSARVLSSK